MADNSSKTPLTQPLVTIPGLVAIPVVAVRLPDGTIALRHPSELQKSVPQIKSTEGNK